MAIFLSLVYRPVNAQVDVESLSLASPRACVSPTVKVPAKWVNLPKSGKFSIERELQYADLNGDGYCDAIRMPVNFQVIDYLAPPLDQFFLFGRKDSWALLSSHKRPWSDSLPSGQLRALDGSSNAASMINPVLVFQQKNPIPFLVTFSYEQGEHRNGPFRFEDAAVSVWSTRERAFVFIQGADRDTLVKFLSKEGCKVQRSIKNPSRESNVLAQFCFKS
jgi:hypothetical protein